MTWPNRAKVAGSSFVAEMRRLEAEVLLTMSDEWSRGNCATSNLERRTEERRVVGAGWHVKIHRKEYPKRADALRDDAILEIVNFCNA